MSLIPATYSISNSEKRRSQEKKNLIGKRTTIASTMSRRRRRRSLSFLLVGGSSNCFLILRLDLQHFLRTPTIKWRLRIILHTELHSFGCCFIKYQSYQLESHVNSS